jgi:general secretion pathway protein A
MYEKYWGLSEAPFENVPDPSFLYESPQHKEALSRMLYGISRRKGCIMLSGEVGSGKTTLARTLLQSLPSENYEVAIIENPRLSPSLFIQEIIYQFVGQAEGKNKIDLLHSLNRILFKNLAAEKDSVIIIDEAQLIGDKSTFEELRLLLNFQLNNRFLLTLILMGQPELRDVVGMTPQFEQRIAIRYHLTRLTFDETVKYIGFRLKRAGLVKSVFTTEAIEKIYNYSDGIPRKINNICDMALLVGWSVKASQIDSKIIANLIDESTDGTDIRHYQKSRAHQQA